MFESVKFCCRNICNTCLILFYHHAVVNRFFSAKNLASVTLLILKALFSTTARRHLDFFFQRKQDDISWESSAKPNLVIYKVSVAAQLQQAMFKFFVLIEKMRLDISCELVALQTIHIKCQGLFYLKEKKKKKKKNQRIACCCCD